MILDSAAALGLVFFACWLSFRLGRRMVWPECLAQLWRGFVTLLCVVFWCHLCVLCLYGVGLLTGCIPFPFRDEVEDLEEELLRRISEGISWAWRISQVSFVSLMCACLCVVGWLVVGRLRRPSHKKSGRSKVCPLININTTKKGHHATRTNLSVECEVCVRLTTCCMCVQCDPVLGHSTCMPAVVYLPKSLT